MVFHKILHGDVNACLNRLSDNEIDCAVTSPPYWSQRDYGFENQIGNESEFDDYISKLVYIFNLLRKKLHPKGIFFLNIGDKYINKYGNTPLGMIPYKLAYYMVQDGWILDDIIIWYKINHMPSSVKNRFTNTYEPVFVFSKSKNNYYREYKEKNNTNNILKIPLQPLSYAHMATYPENLVEELLNLLDLNPGSIILDPFGGSGTTCKSVQNINASINSRDKRLNSYMIEAQKEYVEIMKERCNILKNDIIVIESIPYNYELVTDEIYIDNKKEKEKEKDKGKDKEKNTNRKMEYIINLKPKEPIFQTESMIIWMLETDEEYNNTIPILFDEDFIDELDDDGVIFIGFPDHSIEKIFKICNAEKWIIRNMIILPVEKKDWIPVFMIVKDTKMIRYKFTIDSIRIDHRTNTEENWNKVDFSGYKVIKSSSFFKNDKDGIISNIISKKNNGMPHWVNVIWEDDTFSFEEVINPPLEERKTEFYCPNCQQKLIKYYHSQKDYSCPSCSLVLWKNIMSIPILKLNEIQIPDFNEQKIKYGIELKTTKKDYNGKFENIDRINMGQSPGARASVSEQYFTMKRYFKIKHGLFSDYLNLHRKNKKLTKKGLTALFPPEYKHTVGHWLRKDMGGSLPKVEDLHKLNEILSLDKNYVELISRMGIKLQTVMPNYKGKNPGDYLEISKEEFIEMIKKTDDTI